MKMATCITKQHKILTTSSFLVLLSALSIPLHSWKAMESVPVPCDQF
jgi:hypothetical protein